MKKLPLVLLSVGLVIIGIIIGVIISIAAYHKVHVILDGPAMEPTIHSGQNLMVNKYKDASEIKRGDIVEYKSSNPLVSKSSKSGKLIHRVIALPGERITIKNETVLVFNAQHPNGFNPDTYSAPNVTTQGDIDKTLSKDSYFVMGDNRPKALDSRTIGPIPFKDIIGKITYQ
jgi:signal peptidase I